MIQDIENQNNQQLENQKRTEFDFVEAGQFSSDIENESKKEKRFPYLKKFENKLEEAKQPFAKDNKMKRMYQRGSSQIAKKMGEEAVEMVIASGQTSDEHFLEEAADVFYYYMMALSARGFKLRDVLKILKKR